MSAIPCRGDVFHALQLLQPLVRFLENRAYEAIALAAEVALLADWLGHDILSLAGPDHAARCVLYDFVVAEWRSRESLCPHRIGPIVRALANQRDELLAFAAQRDQDLAALARELELPLATLRDLFNTEALAVDHPAQTVRASSVIENLNRRLRSYFFLRRHLGPDYLALLQFFLNHRRFLRSERPERIGKSPADNRYRSESAVAT
jgi:hypothetical protein